MTDDARIRQPTNTGAHVYKEEKQQKKRRASALADQETNKAATPAETSFTVECPVWPESKRYKARASRADLYTEHARPSTAGSTQLGIDFAVRPGKAWHDLPRFNNAKFTDPVEVIYAAGQFVYVNRRYPIPSAPATEASEDEKLAFDRQTFWVGLVSEFRAATAKKVWVKLFWLYWPEELPMGRQPYHGKREVILSNHVDIIEARSIACHADLSHWDENDDSNKLVLSERYWRQTYDLTKMAPPAHDALSELRKFCVCGDYDTPDVDMYQCPKRGCGMWNHQTCLVADLEERAWAQFQQGQLTHEIHEMEERKTIKQKLARTVGHFVDKGFRKPVRDEAHSGIVTSRSQRARLAANGSKPWSGKLAGTIQEVRKSSDKVTHCAIITQLVPTSKSKANPAFVPEEWNMALPCLRCRHSLN